MAGLSPILAIAAGLILLLTGRRIFWLAAAMAAFLFAYQFIQRTLGPGPVGIIIAVVVGMVFAWLAISFIRTVGVIIGALAGAVALPYLMSMLGVDMSWWILALIGAVIGIILVSVAFNFGLVLMTSWMGANVVSGELGTLLALSAGVVGIIFFVLLIIGILAQSIGGRGGSRPAPPPRRSRT